MQKRRVGRPTDKEGIDKDKILRIALQAFAEFGFDGVSVNTIAKRAGVHDSLLHYHFGSKLDIWQKSIMQVGRKYVESSDRTVKLFKGSDYATLGKALIRHYVYFLAENIEFNQVLQHELTQTSERTEWVIDTCLIPFSERIDMFYKYYMDSEPAYKMSLAHSFSFTFGIASTFFNLQALFLKKHNINVFDEEQIETHVDLVTEILFATIFKKA